MHTLRGRARIALLVAGLLGAVTGRADAQGLGYAVGGLAGVSGFFGSLATVHAAGGGELLIADRAGVGGAVGFMGTGSFLGMLSVNGVLHLVPSRPGHTASPFVTGGRSAFGESDIIFGTWDLGAGVDLWPRDRVGVRLEFRDHIRTDSRGNVQYWTIRAGVVFR
jgi:hypothetical protein